MIFFLFFLFELLILFFISRQLTKVVSSFLFSLTKNPRLTITILSFLFLPGVVLHELAHFLMARIVFVATGDIEFVPSFAKASEGQASSEIKLGSVAVARSDPFRRFLIGVAPLIVGVGVLLVVLAYSGQFLPSKTEEFFTLEILGLPATPASWLAWRAGKLVGVLYVVFEISTTMFSSKKDMEGSTILVVIVALLVALLYLLGVRIQLDWIEKLFTPKVTEFFWKTDLFLLLPLVLNTGIWGALRLILKRL